MGGIAVAIHVLSWTVRVTLDSKVEARPDMALLDITHMIKELQNFSLARQYLVFLADAAHAETLSHERLALA